MLRLKPGTERELSLEEARRRYPDFCADVQSGDQILEFCSSDETWRGLCGREGVRIIRNGKVVDELITVMN